MSRRKYKTPDLPPYRGALTDGPSEVMALPAMHPAGKWADRYGLFDACFDKITVPGNWAQFGVFNGGTARNHLIPALGDSHLYLFDSYEGLPEDWGKYHRRRYFATAVPKFKDQRVTNVVGLFEETLPGFDFGGALAFLDIDCDLYSSTVTILRECNEHIVPGTVLKFDEVFGFEEWAQHEYLAIQEWLVDCGREIEWFARGGIYWAACVVLR